MRFILGAIFAALTVTLVSIPSKVEAGCFSSHQYTQSYTQSYTPYQTVYSNQGYYNNNIVVQPLAISVAIIPSTFYSVLPELAYARVNQEVANEAANKASELTAQKILQNLKVPNQALPEQNLVQEAHPSQGKEGLNLVTMKDMVSKSCVKCHGKGSDFDLSDINSLTRAQRLEIVYRIMTDDPKLKMPKNGPNVSTRELDAAHGFVLSAPRDVNKTKDVPAAVLPKIPQSANKE